MSNVLQYNSLAGFIVTAIVLTMFLPPAFVAADLPTVDRDRLSGIDDDSPLARSGDKAGWDYLFGLLRETSRETFEQARADSVGFMELDRQPVEYRGRLVRIAGKLLRCHFVPTIRTPGPFDEDEVSGANRPGFYESWVLVEDKPDIPISVCSLEIPEGFPTGDDLSESVRVTGYFYKRRLFLSEEGQEVTTPTLLARSFRWSPAVDRSEPKQNGIDSQTNSRRFGQPFIWMLCFLILLWLIFRTMGRRLSVRSPSRERIRFRFSDADKSDSEKAEPDVRIVLPGFTHSGEDDSHPTVTLTGEKTEIVLPEQGSQEDDSKKGTDGPSIKIIPVWGAVLFGVFFDALFGSMAFLPAAEPPVSPIDAEFTKMLLQMDDLSWGALGDEVVPLEQQREPILGMVDQMRRFVPPSFLKKGVAHAFPGDGLPFSVLAADPAQYRGKAFELRGNVVYVEDIPLNPAEKKMLEIPMISRCRFRVGDRKDEESGGDAEVLTAFAPSAWKRNAPIRERAALVGIYIKRIAPDAAEEKETKVKPEDGIFNATDGLVPLLVTTRIQWFPDTFLGDLGMDVGSFEQVPALKISDLKASALDVSPSLRLLGRNETVRRAFKFTEADREPFYGLLKTLAATPPGRIEREARMELEKENKKTTSVVPLFNDPGKTRGVPVLLYGTAKRVLTTLVEDPEVRELYGIDRYYQIYLYTDDSQGNPLVVCVRSLPEGMPTGSAPDYAEQVTIGAVPYKLWVYETSARLEEGDGRKPSYAPLLVGRSPIWHPKAKVAAPPGADSVSEETRTTVSFVLFAVLIFIWFFMRRFKTKRSLEFKLGRR